MTSDVELGGLAAALLGAAADGAAPQPASVLIVLCVGVFLGNTAMGICGFGTAILHLSVWALAQAVGLAAGSLRLAVLTCACAMTVGMVPLFFLSDARTHAITPLAVSIPLSKAVAAPMGAVVLKLLPVQQLEAVVSVLMLLMLVLLNRRPLARAAHATRAWLITQRSSSKGSRCKCSTPASVHAAGIEVPGALTQPLLQPAAGPEAQQHPELASHDVSVHDSRHNGSDGGGSSAGASGEDAALLLAAADVPPDDSADAIVCVGEAAGGSDASGQGVALPPSSNARIDGDGSWRHWWWLFSLGSVAGFWAGLLTGATGIGGPPLILLYAFLGASKEQVRGTSAIYALVQDQWIGYFLLGLLKRDELRVYAAACVAGGLGMGLGHSLQRHMDQRHFGVVMTCLMGVCWCLMSASALGLIQLVDGGA